MTQRVLPEWSKDELEYVEPTQVVRSFGYDVFANVKAFDGKYKNSFIERVKQIDLTQRRQELTAGLQQPWDNAVEPDDKSEGWRNRVRGQGHAAFLMQGIPVEGLPEKIYEIRAAMGIRPGAGGMS